MRYCKLIKAMIVADYHPDGVRYELYITWRNKRSAKLFTTHQTVASWDHGMQLYKEFKRL